MTVTGTMMRALVTQFVAALLVATLAIGTIAAVHSPKPALQPIRAVGIDELPNSGLMSCADASQPCLGVYEPALIVMPSQQVMATRWGEFEQRPSLTIDPVEFLLALTERKTSVLDASERR